MRNGKLDCKSGQGYLIGDRINRRYLSGIDAAEGFLLYSARPVYFADLRYFSAVKEKLRGTGVKPAVYNGTDSVKAEISSQEIKELYIDFTRVTLSEYEEYKKAFGGVEIRDCSAALSALRSVKNAAETANIRKACEIAETAVKDAFSYAYEGITETELRKYLEERMEALGGEGAAFDTIVAFGKNSAVPHHETGDDRLEADSAILIDTGCRVNGYCSDITRTAFFGEPDGEFLRAYKAVYSANIAAEREIHAGISAKDADAVARDILGAAGYRGYFTHSLGHGVGLEIHESPRLSPKSDEMLEENAVFTVEPGIYIDGMFGIRIEDTCVMSGGKAVRLFKDGKELTVLPVKKRKGRKQRRNAENKPFRAGTGD